MLHKMQLAPQPMSKIKSGRKTIELRLYDEKRRLIKIGDKIEFTDTENPENKLLVKVLGIYRFESFAELYEKLDLLKCGYDEYSVKTASPKDMNIYYSEERQAEYGVVGIETEVV